MCRPQKIDEEDLNASDVNLAGDGYTNHHAQIKSKKSDVLIAQKEPNTHAVNLKRTTAKHSEFVYKSMLN